MSNLLINANPVIIDEDDVVVKQNQDGSYDLPGGEVKEGENLEQACIKRAKENNLNINIIKPLNPKISWILSCGKKIPQISINYLSNYLTVKPLLTVYP